MIKRSFIGLTAPRLKCDLVEPGPREPEMIPMPPRLILMLDEALDSTKETRIKKGDTAKKGERLFLYKESTRYVTAPTSGTITSIAPFTGDFGKNATYLVLEKDGKDESVEGISEFADVPDIASADGALKTLPGAPPLELLAAPNSNIKKIVISGMDSDLMSTTRQYLASKCMDDVKDGIELLKNMTGITDVFMAIPEKMSQLSAFQGMNTIRLTEDYIGTLPQMIMKNHLGIAPVAGSTCEEQGVCFMSIEAVLSLARAYKDKAPVFDKVITVIGKDGGVKRVRAVIGTPIHRILSQLGLETQEMDRIIIGGPLKGFSAYTLYHPVQPDMDTIIIQDYEQLPGVSDYPCINCGKCVRICPAGVPVNLLVRYLEANLYQEAVDSFDLDSCIDCGLCSYVCTARIPIFQYIKLGKHEQLMLEAEMEMEAENA